MIFLNYKNYCTIHQFYLIPWAKIGLIQRGHFFSGSGTYASYQAVTSQFNKK